MSGKNQYPFTANWQSTNPQTNFNPVPSIYGGGSQPSGVLTGAMASTNVIYSNIFEISRMDNIGFDVSWSGTPTGTLLVLVSNGGVVWPELTFSPALSQPAGSAAFYALSLNQLPFKYVMFQYTNSSGTGVLTINGQCRDLN